MDGLAQVRRRLFDLVAWFGEDGARFPAAQAAWRTRGELWERAVERDADALLAAADDELPPLAGALAPDAALRALEAADLAGWLWAGSTRGGPPQVFGAGAAARYVVRLARPRAPRTARQPGVIYTHLRHHALVPIAIHVPTRPAPFRVRVISVERGLAAPAPRAAVRLATTSFGEGATIDWAGARARALRGAEARGDALWGALVAAGAERVDLLVVPELTVPPADRAALIRRLRWADPAAPRPALIVPGSFHEQVGDRFVHRAVVLDGATGNALAVHDKLAPYGELDGFAEDIALGDEITVLVTPIGTVAVAICKDFCDDHVGALWHQVQPEWLLVPAFGRGASAHEQAAHRIARMAGTVTALAHQGDPATGVETRSFVHDGTTCHPAQSVAPALSVHNIAR